MYPISCTPFQCSSDKAIGGDMPKAKRGAGGENAERCHCEPFITVHVHTLPQVVLVLSIHTCTNRVKGSAGTCRSITGNIVLLQAVLRLEIDPIILKCRHFMLASLLRISCTLMDIWILSTSLRDHDGRAQGEPCPTLVRLEWAQHVCTKELTFPSGRRPPNDNQPALTLPSVSLPLPERSPVVH